MRRAVVALAGLVAATPAAAAPPPPPLINQAIKDAAAVGHPLVVEVFATWCRPCAWFDQHVMPRPEVIAALDHVDYIRYDIDTPEGEAVVKRYRTTSVPMFLVIDPNGVAVARVAGLQGRGVKPADAADTVAAWFVGFLIDARDQADELDAITRAIAADPRDAAARLRLARYLRAGERRVEAIDEYRAIVTARPALIGTAVATAAAELDDLVASEIRIKDAVDAALRYARSYPESGLTTGRLALAAASGRVSAGEIQGLLIRHLAAVNRGADLAEALRLALALRMRDLADTTLAAWERDLPRAALPQLVEVERMLLDSDYQSAARLVRAQCADPPRGIELQCYVLATAIRESWRGAPGVRRILSAAADYLEGLDRPGSGGASELARIDDLAASDPALGNAIAHSLRIARRRCMAASDVHGVVYVEIAVADDPGPPTQVQVRARDVSVAAQRCVQDVVAGEQLPEAAIAPSDTLWAVLAFEPELGHTLALPDTVPPALSGLMIDGFARGGPTSSVGIGLEAMLGLGRVADFRGLIAGELEAGLDDASESTLAARGLVGLGIGSARWQISALAGLGASRFGADVPAAIEAVLETRLDGTIGPVRVHLWSRGTWLVGTDAREPESAGAFFGADETALGAGFGLRQGDGHGVRGIYAGGVVEQRAVGTAYVFVIGLPVGAFY